MLVPVQSRVQGILKCKVGGLCMASRRCHHVPAPVQPRDDGCFLVWIAPLQHTLSPDRVQFFMEGWGFADKVVF